MTLKSTFFNYLMKACSISEIRKSGGGGGGEGAVVNAISTLSS
jgi:hypothetical protein